MGQASSKPLTADGRRLKASKPAPAMRHPPKYQEIQPALQPKDDDNWNRHNDAEAKCQREMIRQYVLACGAHQLREYQVGSRSPLSTKHVTSSSGSETGGGLGKGAMSSSEDEPSTSAASVRTTGSSSSSKRQKQKENSSPPRSLRRTVEGKVRTTARVVHALVKENDGSLADNNKKQSSYYVDHSYAQELRSACRSAAATHQQQRVKANNTNLLMVYEKLEKTVQSTMHMIATEWLCEDDSERRVKTLNYYTGSRDNNFKTEGNKALGENTPRAYLHDGIFYYIWGTGADAAWHSRMEDRGTRLVLHHFSPHVYTPIVTRATYCGVHATVIVCCPIEGDRTCVARRDMSTSKSHMSDAIISTLNKILNNSPLSSSVPPGTEVHYGRDGRFYIVGCFGFLELETEFPGPRSPYVFPNYWRLMMRQHRQTRENEQQVFATFVDSTIPTACQKLNESLEDRSTKTARQWLQETHIPVSLLALAISNLMTANLPPLDLINALQAEIIARSFRDLVGPKLWAKFKAELLIPGRDVSKEVRNVVQHYLRLVLEYPSVESSSNDKEAFISRALIPHIKKRYLLNLVELGCLSVDIDPTDGLRSHTYRRICELMGFCVKGGSVYDIIPLVDAIPLTFDLPEQKRNGDGHSPLRELCRLQHDIRTLKVVDNESAASFRAVVDKCLGAARGNDWEALLIASVSGGVMNNIDAHDLSDPETIQSPIHEGDSVLLCIAYLKIAQALERVSPERHASYLKYVYRVCAEHMLLSDTSYQTESATFRLRECLIPCSRALGVVEYKAKCVSDANDKFRLCENMINIQSNLNAVQRGTMLLDLAEDLAACAMGEEGERVALAALALIAPPALPPDHPDAVRARLTLELSRSFKTTPEREQYDAIESLAKYIEEEMMMPEVLHCTSYQVCDALYMLGCMYYRADDMGKTCAVLARAKGTLLESMKSDEEVKSFPVTDRLSRMERRFKVAYRKLQFRSAARIQACFRGKMLRMRLTRWLCDLETRTQMELQRVQESEELTRLSIEQLGFILTGSARMTVLEKLEDFVRRTQFVKAEDDEWKMLLPHCARLHNSVFKTFWANLGDLNLICAMEWSSSVISHRKVDFVLFQLTPEIESSQRNIVTEEEESIRELYRRAAARDHRRVAHERSQMEEVFDEEEDTRNDLLTERWTMLLNGVEELETLWRRVRGDFALARMPPWTVLCEAKEHSFRSYREAFEYESNVYVLQFYHDMMIASHELYRTLSLLRPTEKLFRLQIDESNARALIWSDVCDVFYFVYDWKAESFSTALWADWNVVRTRIIIGMDLVERTLERRRWLWQDFCEIHIALIEVVEENQRYEIEETEELLEREVLSWAFYIQIAEMEERVNFDWRRRAFLVRSLQSCETNARSVLTYSESWRGWSNLISAQETFHRTSYERHCFITFFERQFREFLEVRAEVVPGALFHRGASAAVSHQEACARVCLEHVEWNERTFVEQFVFPSLCLLCEESFDRFELFGFMQRAYVQSKEAADRREIAEAEDEQSLILCERRGNVLGPDVIAIQSEVYYRRDIEQEERAMFRAIVDVQLFDFNEISTMQKRKASAGVRDLRFMEELERHAMSRDDEEFWERIRRTRALIELDETD